jgi:Flp pilus assembly protein TadB
MSISFAGALAIALAVSCALLAPLGGRTIRLRFGHPDVTSLRQVAWRRPLWHWEAIRVSCLIACALLAQATGLPVVAAALLGGLAPSVVVRSRAGAALRRARPATTRLLRATEAALRSGGGLPEALRRATDAADDRIACGPFRSALRAFDLGAPLDEALRSSAFLAFDRRIRIALETLAVGISSRLPADRAATLLAAVADRLAFEERLDEEIRSKTSGLRSQVLLLAAVVPGLALYLALTVPSLGDTLASPIGRTLLVPGGVILEIAGLALSRRFVDEASR